MLVKCKYYLSERHAVRPAEGKQDLLKHSLQFCANHCINVMFSALYA